MQEVLMMVMEGCPHCARAKRMIEKLQEETPAYRQIPVRIADENVEIRLADSLDYYYVPALYVAGEKIMEGVPNMELVEKTLKKALEA